MVTTINTDNLNNGKTREIKIGICDDNSMDRRRVLNWIAINKPGINLRNVREFACGEAVLDYLRHSVIDILFLDCRMNGLDGIQTAMQIRKTNCKMVIIILSNYTGYALYGYDAGIYRYLLKSEFDQKIDDIFEGALRQYANDDTPIMSIKTLSGVVYFPIADILYIESHSRIKKYVLSTMYMYSTYGRNADIEIRLKPYGFIRPHNSFIINSRYVVCFEKDWVQLRHGVFIPISKGRRKISYDELTVYLNEIRNAFPT